MTPTGTALRLHPITPPPSRLRPTKSTPVSSVRDTQPVPFPSRPPPQASPLTDPATAARNKHLRTWPPADSAACHLWHSSGRIRHRVCSRKGGDRGRVDTLASFRSAESGVVVGGLRRRCGCPLRGSVFRVDRLEGGGVPGRSVGVGD